MWLATQALYEELLAGVPGVKVHCQPFEVRTDASDSRVYEESFSGMGNFVRFAVVKD